MVFFPSRFINSHNRKHVSFQVGVNHLADRSPEELAVLRGRTHTSVYNGGLPFNPDLSTLKDVPDSMDWRLYGNKMSSQYCTDIPYLNLKQSKLVTFTCVLKPEFYTSKHKLIQYKIGKLSNKPRPIVLPLANTSYHVRIYDVQALKLSLKIPKYAHNINFYHSWVVFYSSQKDLVMTSSNV